MAKATSGPGEVEIKDAFVVDTDQLWAGAVVPYYIDHFEFNGTIEPLFLDEDIPKIISAMDLINEAVPCIKFR